MFLFRLAFHLGMTVRRLLEELTVDELIEWMAYYRIEPFGFEVENFRFGAIPATTVNCTPRRRGSKPAKPSDFYPLISRGPQLPERLRKELVERRSKRSK